MSGIRILDELSRELKSERQTLKVPTNWLDRLRSKKGFPTGGSPDLATFLSSNANTIPQIPNFHENCQTLPLRRRPRKQAHPTKVVRVCPPSTSTSTAAAAATFPNIIVLSDDSDEEKSQQQQQSVAGAVAVAADPAAVADEEEAADGDDHDEGGPQVPRVGGPPPFPIEPIQLAVQEEEEEELDEEEEEEEEEERSTITDESVISG